MVTHCICHNVPFETVARLAAEGASLEQISGATGCCTGCGTCLPYVRVVIATGATRLPVMTTAQADQVIAESVLWPRTKPMGRPGSGESTRPPHDTRGPGSGIK